MVEKKEGVFEYKGEKFFVVDFLGMYFLMVYLIDELVVRNFLFNGNFDVVVNVVDVIFFLRNFFLIMEIFEMGLKNVVIVLNKIDLVEKKGIWIDFIKMLKVFGVFVVVMSVKEGIGVEELKEKIYEMVNGMVKINFVVLRYDLEVEREIEYIIGCLKGMEFEKCYFFCWLVIKFF